MVFLLQILVRMLGSEPNIGVCREMKDKVCAIHRGVQKSGIGEVAFNQLESRTSLGIPDEFAFAGHKAIVDDNLMTLSQQPIDQIASDKSCTASYQAFHG